LPIPIVVTRYRYILCHPSQECRRGPSVRRPKNIPTPIPIHCYVRLPIPIIVCWHWYVLCHPPPFYPCDPAVRGAKNIPDTIPIHRSVCLPITVVITWSGHRSSGGTSLKGISRITR